MRAIASSCQVPQNYQAVFLPAFARAHLAFCAAAIFLRAAIRFPRMGTIFACVPATCRTFAHRAR